ncbi:MAG: 3-oxoacyl-ACP reductase FabG [Ruminococcaceae bacterium]|nr:3-oxoacyl-ACP reductase FabG [Oscillospiraceae bacterium]
MKRVFITGGSRGIGRACVEYFAKQGDRVVFVYRNDDFAAETVSESCGALAIKADLSVAEEAVRAVRDAVEHLGGIDVLVNNAGISQIKLFTDISDEDWQRMISTNLSGAFFVTREAVKPMISAKQGRIINIGSMWGKCGASCEVHYSAAKAALSGMTKALAKEVGPSGITVNCVEPGVIATDMNSELDSETMSQLCDETPLGRVGKPSDVAKLVGFLASDDADFITGQIIGVDGGFAI